MNRIQQGFVSRSVSNPVVLTGDVHAHWASDLKLNYDDPTTATVGAELVCSSITSGGNGADSNPADHPFLKINPHLRFYNNQRGYVSTRITPGRLDADFKVVPYVATPGAAAHTRASFAIEDRVPGLHQTYDRPLDPAALLAGAPDTVAAETDRP